MPSIPPSNLRSDPGCCCRSSVPWRRHQPRCPSQPIGVPMQDHQSLKKLDWNRASWLLSSDSWG
ncbi:hypothetical protein CONPUDRAFT_84701 [Coniophora puteana RWD-64-598 SS2]|uniref:Uncharacterized protein n=1 Tax=Coniophora puteana (strain RWD-64-598) TaxID=741705 RepID=A0A5M3MC51_CONPW|nr:uncharacterized protein CONPUDRAFT_84701 [Coniophora puteana RWD-64-598 SS2]EIW76822.1 hypothetical protein CONPUDRAFT_84701 [Coniophora puteana RWD-64-598 SS2]